MAKETKVKVGIFISVEAKKILSKMWMQRLKQDEHIKKSHIVEEALFHYYHCSKDEL